MNHCPLVHVLLPVYNHKKYLSDSIKSVLEQTYQNVKLIILNDGSTENLNEVLDIYSSNNKIEFYSQKNLGLPTALSNLYEKSLNSNPIPTYITWHSADNIYSDNAIEKMVQFLEKNPDIDLVYTNVRLIDSTGNPLKNSNYRIDDQTIEDSSILNLDYRFDSITEYNDNFVNACFLTRSKIEAILPPFKNTHRGYEDFIHLLQLRLISKGSHIGSTSFLHNYRIHEETLTSTLDTNQLANAQSYCVKTINFITNESLQENFSYTLLSKMENTTNSVHCTNIKQLITEIKARLIDSDLRIGINLTPRQAKVISAERLPDIHITKTHGFTHESHRLLFEIPPLTVAYKLSGTTQLKSILYTGLSYLPKVYTRARNRNLKMFEGESQYQEKLLIFTPSNPDPKLVENISSFALKNGQKLVVLFCQSTAEKEVADKIYLNSNCAKNFRIVQIRKDEQGNLIDENLLLNCLGSVQSIISITNFTNDTHFGNVSFISDLVAEFIFANLSGRQLIVPKIYLGIKGYQFLNSPLVFVSDLENLTFWKDFNLLGTPLLKICDKTLVQFSYPDSFTKVINASFCYSI